MLKPVPMAKVAIVGPKTQLAASVGTLHEHRLLHIDDYAPGDEGFELGSPLPEGTQVSERLLRVRGLLKGAHIEAPESPVRKFALANLKALQGELADVEGELGRLVDRRNALLDEKKRFQEEAALLQRIQNFPLPLELLSGYRTIVTATGFVPKEADPDALRRLHGNVELTTSQEAEGLLLFVAAPKSVEKALNDALSKLQFSPLELLRGAQGTPAARLAALAKEESQTDAQIAEVEAKIGAVRERHAPAFLALDEHLTNEADKTSAPVRFRTTKNSFMVEGWVPHEDLAGLKYALSKSTDDRVFVTRLGPEAAPRARDPHGGAHAEPESPPVKLQNGKMAGNYQLLTDTYSRPKYTEFDPTLFFYVGFPLFYGIMLGDIGYGLVLLFLLAAGVFSKVFDFFGFQSKRELTQVFLHCGILSILFGFLYTEFFGVELLGHNGVMSHYATHLGPIPFPLSRLEEPKILMLLTLYVAVVHMLIGLGLGYRNAAQAHGTWEAIKHRGSGFLIMLAAGFAIVGGLPGVLGEPAFAPPDPQPLLYAAAGLFAIGFLLFLLAEGAMAILEVFTVLSNVLSYTRLAAIGLAGAGIALAGNQIAQLVGGGGTPGGYVAAAFILLFFHGLNMVLGVLSPALHSLRLHYVEFFTKFYEGGGEPYAPFGAQRRYTTKEVKP